MAIFDIELTRQTTHVFSGISARTPEEAELIVEDLLSDGETGLIVGSEVLCVDTILSKDDNADEFDDSEQQGTD